MLCKCVYHTCSVYNACGTKCVDGYCVPSVNPMADIKIDTRHHLHVALLFLYYIRKKDMSNTKFTFQYTCSSPFIVDGDVFRKSEGLRLWD
jgi:hypothetical protein